MPGIRSGRRHGVMPVRVWALGGVAVGVGTTASIAIVLNGPDYLSAWLLILATLTMAVTLWQASIHAARRARK